MRSQMTELEARPSVAALLLLDGRWVPGEGKVAAVTNKFTLKPFAEVAAATEAQTDAMIEASARAFQKGPPGAFQRGAILDRAAGIIASEKEEFIRIIQSETGFTKSDATGEVVRSIETLKLSAEEARRLSGDMVPIEGAPGQVRRLAFTLRVPLGVVLAVTPFNAPLNTVAHKIAPAFAAGNAVVLKPSGHTPLTACKLAEVMIEAGIPKGFLSILHGEGDVVQHAIANRRIRFIAFTGSTEVGQAIQSSAGLRRTQMELGSIACTILCDDADLDVALPKIVAAGYRKAGQVCTSVQILLVQEGIGDIVKRRMTELVKAVTSGDPSIENTVTGPLISLRDAKRVDEWICEAINQGATRLVGGERKGAIIPPTLLSDTHPDMKVSNTEIFGPVICIEMFDELSAAILRVNSTPFGLATGIFTNRLSDAFEAARALDVGGVHINETSSSRVDMLPYGGTKDSGFGREGPHHAVREMTEERVITITA